jgi:hypothetical protein
MSNFLINSLATSSQCARCKGWVYEAFVYGFLTRVEPNPLNLEEEIAMRLEGRKIWETLKRGDGFELVKRTEWHIKKGSGRALVLADHDCRMPTYFEPAPLFEKPTMKEPQF